MFDDRTNLTRQVAADLSEFFQDQVFMTVIPRSIRLAEAPSFGKPILTYDPAPAGPKAISSSPKRFWTMNKTDNPRKALGKGLNALLPTRSTQPPPPARRPHGAPHENPAQRAIDAIDPNPLQPRRVFQSRTPRGTRAVDPRQRHHSAAGRPQAAGNRYQLVAGERRWRAAKLAGLTQVPVVVQDIPDDRLLEITLIENIQREDLNPIETGHRVRTPGAELNLSPEQIGQRTGKDRTTIINSIRLLQLPPDLQQLVAERRLSAGHARCLLGLPTAELQREVARKVVAARLVRPPDRAALQKMMEGTQAQACRRGQARSQRQGRHSGDGARPRHPVRLWKKPKQKGGRIEIDYYSPEDLDRIYDD